MTEYQENSEAKLSKGNWENRRGRTTRIEAESSMSFIGCAKFVEETFIKNFGRETAV
jgi:hypothetical protein